MRAHPFIRRSMLAITLWALSGLGYAHLMPAQQGTVNIVGSAAFVVLAVPVSGIAGADDNRDGRLSDTELVVHRDLLAEEIVKRFGIFDGAVRTPAEVMQMVAEPDERQAAHPPLGPTKGDAGTTHFLVMMRHSLHTENSALRVDTDLFGLMAHEAQLTLKLSHGGLSEVAVLTPRHRSHLFFQPAEKVLQDYLALGVEHIVLGFDHLLFLTTLLVSTRGWRYWVSLLTGFTLAHSITLGATMLGIVHVSPQWVEPGIAASIVLMAALNLAQVRIPPFWHLGTVTAFGLLHGLGFAGSMAQLGLHSTYQITSLVGFNLGIELGQALFVAVVWGLARATVVGAAAVKKASPAPLWLGKVSGLAASTCAMALGSFWLLERLGLVRG